MGEKCTPTLAGAELIGAKFQIERVVLAAFIHGLKGEPGLQLKYTPPLTWEETTRRAVLVEQAIKKSDFRCREAIAVSEVTASPRQEYR